MTSQSQIGKGGGNMTACQVEEGKMTVWKGVKMLVGWGGGLRWQFGEGHAKLAHP